MSEKDNEVPDSAGRRGENSSVQRYRRMTEKLYQCLVTHYCTHKIGFGSKSFCSWRLHNPENSDQNIPCPGSDSEGSYPPKRY